MSYARKTRPHRCVKCEARRTLAKLWSEYDRKPRCHACGYYRLYFCKDRMPSRWGRKLACNCGGYHHRHRKGSKFCEFNPNVDKHVEERYEAIL